MVGATTVLGGDSWRITMRLREGAMSLGARGLNGIVFGNGKRKFVFFYFNICSAVAGYFWVKRM